MTGELFNVPLTDWVRGTIEKMEIFGHSDISNWCDCWVITYEDLGGKSESSGSKGCPQHAAYGLWRLGRIAGTQIPYQQKDIKLVNDEYGKNAAYAVIALELLAMQKSSYTKAGIWTQVREIYRRTVHEDPAISQQGAITVAVTLFEEGQIVTEVI